MLKFTLMNLTSGKSAMCFFGIFLGKPWLLQIYINLRYVTNTDLPKFQRQVQGKTCWPLPGKAKRDSAVSIPLHKHRRCTLNFLPICSMYSIFTIIYLQNWAVYGVNDGKYGKYSSTMEHMGLRLVGGLEPWNFMTFPFSWECLHPNWLSLTHIFQRGLLKLYHQPVALWISFEDLWTSCLFTHFFAHEKNIRSTCWT